MYTIQLLHTYNTSKISNQERRVKRQSCQILTLFQRGASSVDSSILLHGLLHHHPELSSRDGAVSVAHLVKVGNTLFADTGWDLRQRGALVTRQHSREERGEIVLNEIV